MALFASTFWVMLVVLEMSKGVEQDVLIDCAQNKPRDVVFLVDTSGSVGTVGFKKMQQVIMKVSMQLTLNNDLKHDRVAVVSFTDRQVTRVDFNEGTSVETVYQKVHSGWHEGGNDDIALGLYYTDNHILTHRRIEAKTTLLVLTDGEAVDGWKMEEYSAQIRNDGVEIVVVDVAGNRQLDDFLQYKKMVGPTGRVRNFKDLQEVVVQKCTTTSTITRTTTTTTTTTSTNTASITTTTTTTTTRMSLAFPLTLKILAVIAAVLSLVCACTCTASSCCQQRNVEGYAPCDADKVEEAWLDRK